MAVKPFDPVWMELSKPREIAHALALGDGERLEAIDRVFGRYELVGDVEGAELFAWALLREPRLQAEMQGFRERTRLSFARELFERLPVLAPLDQAQEPVQATIDDLLGHER